MTTPAPPSGSRARLLAAAAAEFAARGYDGANVGRIARAARLNKAMIYYHFKNKAALYAEIFRDMIAAVLARARAVAASDAAPPEKISGFIRAVLAEAQARPHFAPMWLREVGEGGRHLDRATIDLVRQVPETLGAIAAEGHAAGVFRRCHPLLLHFGVVGPIVLYSASQPIRSRFARTGATALASPSPEDLLAHVEHTTLATLTAKRTGEHS